MSWRDYSDDDAFVLGLNFPTVERTEEKESPLTSLDAAIAFAHFIIKVSEGGASVREIHEMEERARIYLAKRGVL